MENLSSVTIALPAVITQFSLKTAILCGSGSLVEGYALTIDTVYQKLSAHRHGDLVFYQDIVMVMAPI